MKEFYPVLKKCALFKGIAEENLEKALQSVSAYIRHYKKNETVHRAGKEITEAAILVKGCCHVSKSDKDGNRVIIGELKIGSSFGESLAYGGIKNNPVTLTATRASSVVFVPLQKITGGGGDPELRAKIIENLLVLLGQKSIDLHIKIDILSKKTLRQKLVTYFEYVSDILKSRAYRIPFTREELADYLGVNRSALSRELGKMQAEGILEYRKNIFILNKVSAEDRFILN